MVIASRCRSLAFGRSLRARKIFAEKYVVAPVRSRRLLLPGNAWILCKRATHIITVNQPADGPRLETHGFFS